MRCFGKTTFTALVACVGCCDGAPRTGPALEAPAGPRSAPKADPVDVATTAVGTVPEPPVLRAVLAAALGVRRATPAPEDPAKERVLIDFRVRDAERAERMTDLDAADVARAFPDAHAAGKPCDPNRPGTPPGERMGGVLLPSVTQVAGSFTHPGAREIALMIDYCPTGAGAPRTRRLLVLEGGVVTSDHEFSAAEPFEEVLAATDLDGDDRAELLLTTSIFEDGRSMVDLSVVSLRRTMLTTLGTWRAVEHCDPRHAERTNLVLHVRVEGGSPVFRAEVTTSRCVYPPSPAGP